MIIAVSDHTANRISTQLNYSKKIITIPNGIDMEKINSIKASGRKSDIIFAGRMLSHKNLDVLINSVAILKKSKPDILCFLIGDGPEKERLKMQVKNLNLVKNVIFIDFLEQENDLYSLMKASKAFILPSTREGFGIVVIEANMCGIPVITIQHRDNGARHLISNGKNGYVCELNIDVLARKIDEVLKNTIDLNISSAVSKRYDWDTIVAELEKAYQKI